MPRRPGRLSILPHKQFRDCSRPNRMPLFQCPRQISSKKPALTVHTNPFLQTNPALNWLNLEDTNTSDASVPALKQLHSMDKLHLKESKVTEAGFQEIKNSLHNATVLSYSTSLSENTLFS